MKCFRVPEFQCFKKMNFMNFDETEFDEVNITKRFIADDQ
jgi:hypothetical protein